MANQLVEFKKEVDDLVEAGEKKEGALMRVIRRYISTSKRILFEGDNYSDEWAAEAKKRGLSNVKTTPHALAFFEEHRNMDVFIKNNVLSESELEARTEIYYESYTKKIQIESRVIAELTMNQVIPAAVTYQNKLIENVRGLKELGLKASSFKSQLTLIEDISKHINIIEDSAAKMIDARKKANKLATAKEQSLSYCEDVKPFFDTIRYHVDKLELIVEDRLWPLPKYREILFIK
jgi:glutamine synthetase